jgi:phage repressor protein C with HTH and peptisase S24 domain
MSRGRQTGRAAPGDTHGTDRSAFVGRLRQILEHWPSADRLARETGVSPSAFRKWLKGEAEPSRERLVALADVAKVSIGWLASGEPPEPIFPQGGAEKRGKGSAADHGTSMSRFLVLPRRPEAAAAGAATPPAPTDSEYIAFRHDWLRPALGIEPARLTLEIAVGESMLPTIREGDLLLVDTGDDECSEYGIYVLEVRGQRLVKRVQRKLDGTLVLISDNEAYQPDTVPPELLPQVKVIGRVVWGGGRL